MFCACDVIDGTARRLKTRRDTWVCGACSKPRRSPIQMLRLVCCDLPTGLEEDTTLAVLTHELAAAGLDATAAVAALLDSEALTDAASYESRKAS